VVVCSQILYPDSRGRNDRDLHTVSGVRRLLADRMISTWKNRSQTNKSAQKTILFQPHKTALLFRHFLLPIRNIFRFKAFVYGNIEQYCGFRSDQQGYGTVGRIRNPVSDPDPFHKRGIQCCRSEHFCQIRNFCYRLRIRVHPG
jgi:hypothetical protein